MRKRAWPQGLHSVSDRFGPFATQLIPATAGKAPHILDGLLMNETDLRIREQCAPDRPAFHR